MTSIVGCADTFPNGESKEDREVNCFGCADAFPATVGFSASAAEREKLVGKARIYAKKIKYVPENAGSA